MTSLVGRVQAAWDDERTQSGVRGVVRRMKQARAARRLAVTAAFGAAALLVALWPRDPSSVVRFSDGSTAQLLDRDSVVVPGPRAPGLLGAQLEAGRARFDVVHDQARRFRVEAGPVSVEVLGTQFVVERAGARTRVSVERGRVRVAWAGGATELGVGQTGFYPPPDEVDQLLRAADRARARGRPAEALPPLEQLLREHVDDVRAPLGAFTLGRVYDELGRRREAAAAYARAAALAPDGPLARDARERSRSAGAR
jgi:ferric-dicitrate binding protein FerR (iron transport regulator)